MNRLRVPSFPVALIMAALMAFPAIADNYENDEPEVPEHGTFKRMWSGSDDKKSGSSSGGRGFFGRLLGGETMGEFEGRYINTLKSRHIEPRGDLEPGRTGLQLARREALGPHNVPVPLPSMKAFAEKIVERLLKGAAISGIVPEVHIVADQQIHGYAFPDGTILIPLGAIANLESEDQFAALLAHELSHIILGHHDSDWFMDTQERGMAALEFALEMREKVKRLQKPSGDGDAVEHLKMRFIAKGVLFASELLVDSPYTRLQEDQADLLGFDLLHSAGYNIREMSKLLDKLAQQEKQRLEEAEERRTGFEAAMKDLEGSESPGSFFKNLFAKSEELFDGLLENIKEEIDSKHRAAQERRKALLVYRTREYADEKRQKSRKKEWLALMNSREVKAAMNGYGHVYASRNSLEAGDYDAAVDEIKKALQQLGPRHGGPRLTAALISARAGNRKEAAFYFHQSLASEYPILSTYTGYAELMRRERNFAESASLLERAGIDLKDAPQLLPDTISHARLSRNNRTGGDKFGLAGLLARCKLSPLKKLPKFCEQARKGKYTNFPPLKVVSRKPLGLHGKFVKVKGATLNVRKGPGGKFPLVTSLKRDAVLSVLDRQKRWLLIRSVDGSEGWVAGWLTTPTKLSKTRSVAPVNRTASGKPKPRASAPAPPPRRAGAGDPGERLKKLKTLFDQGLITDGEYKTKRQEILKSL